MNWIILVALGLISCFGFVLLFGAPYLPTLSPQVETALQLAQLQPGDRLLELGCGDGKVLIAAAKKGIYTVGYEINPILVVIAWARTRRYRKYVRVVWGNFWLVDLPKSDAIFVFLLPRYMQRLDRKITESIKGQRKLVSFAFTIPGKKVYKSKNGVWLYLYQ